MHPAHRPIALCSPVPDRISAACTLLCWVACRWRRGPRIVWRRHWRISTAVAPATSPTSGGLCRCRRCGRRTALPPLRVISRGRNGSVTSAAERGASACLPHTTRPWLRWGVACVLTLGVPSAHDRARAASTMDAVLRRNRWVWVCGGYYRRGAALPMCSYSLWGRPPDVEGVLT
jgi:hypothetical protein